MEMVQYSKKKINKISSFAKLLPNIWIETNNKIANKSCTEHVYPYRSHTNK